MSDVIQLLPDSVANQIAAGEVIQRPASVIKELVENSIDAGARSIKVFVIDAGRTSIQVIDDGRGMSDTDARLSFERHATSKIRKADDLFALQTMGFRGEALASIAAVAQVELRTRMEGQEVGTCITLSGSKVTGQEPVSCPVGSNFTVENLFFNVPARRKFLKTNATELNNIMTAYERIVLVYPSIAFSLHSNGSELLNLRAGSLRQRIIDVFGKRFNKDILPVEVDTAICKITGFVGKPESARKKGAHEYFFVNGRYMKHPYFHKAVMNAFERLVPTGMQVPYFIYLEVNPADIDVNIHPTKTEIKFENEQAIWQILTAAIKDSIGRFCEVPSIDFDTEGRPDIPVYDPTRDVSMPDTSFNPSYNPFTSGSDSPAAPRTTDRWQILYEEAQAARRSEKTDMFALPDDEPAASAPVAADDFIPTMPTDTPSGPFAMPDTPSDQFMIPGMEQPSETPWQPAVPQEQPSLGLISEKSPAHYQYKGRYIMTAVKSGLMIIDQQRADIRIRYERYLGQMEQAGNSGCQHVLFPEVVRFSPSETVMLNKILPELTSVGFDLTDLGHNSYAVNGIPAGLEGLDTLSLLHSMVSDAIENASGSLDDIKKSLALSMARSSAIPHGQILNNNEMENIVNELFACSNVNYTPDGKSVICILPQREIEHLLD
ncbi:MAG: DNA mismatch repair endonuclease MutL [Prevotella sp.]|nr:DNA mismatch repair endonuclease MutL [Prevotella sp.]